MTKTTNYQLNQWAKSDRIMMDDFNDAMEKIDAGVAGAAKIATGTYTGDGSTTRTFNLGFTPKAVIVRRVTTVSDSQVVESDQNYTPLMAVTGTNYAVLHIVEGGFAINHHIMVNSHGIQYLYIAFA